MCSACDVTTTTSTNALYGEATIPLTDTFRIIGGLRESWDHRTFDFNNAGTITPTFGINFSHFDYRAGVEYDVAPRSMLYATVSSGYRPGGLSAFNPVTNAPNSFQSEVTTAFEIGSRAGGGIARQYSMCGIVHTLAHRDSPIGTPSAIPRTTAIA